MQHMMDSLFITMSNFTLMRRDAYLDHLRPGVKLDNRCTLRNAPLHSYGLFPDDALRKAEEDITKFESTRRISLPGSGSGGFPQKKSNRFYDYHQASTSKASHRTSPQPVLPRVLQPPLLVPKPNNRWRPILDHSALNRFLHVKTFKMETPESIRLSLQQGEWVTSLDFSDAYFHIPINQVSRKYLQLHLEDQTL